MLFSFIENASETAPFLAHLVASLLKFDFQCGACQNSAELGDRSEIGRFSWARIFRKKLNFSDGGSITSGDSGKKR